MIFGELVINEVIKYPEFYQMNKEEYKESSKKNLFYPKIAAALSITCAREITSVEVKDAWEKLVRMYSEYRRKLVSATTSGSGAARQPHPHQDLMDKLSFLSDKSSNRKGKSSLVVSKNKNLSELDKIVEQKEAAGIIVSEPNRFCRMKKSNNTDDSFKSELTAMSSAIKNCAQNFSDRLMKHNQQANAAEPYQKPILKYFEKIEEDEKKDTLMKEMLAVIIQYPQKPQQ